MTLTRLMTELVEKRERTSLYLPKHRADYDRTVDVLRKNGTVVPARHSADPESVRAVIVR